MSDRIEIAKPLIPGTADTPMDARSRVDSVADIANPYRGGLFFSGGKTYRINTLKSKQIGSISVPNAAVDEYVEMATVKDVENHHHDGVYAPLEGGKIPATYLNISSTKRVVATYSALLALPGMYPLQEGDRAYVIDAAGGGISGGAEYIWTGYSWVLVSASNTVTVAVSWGNLQNVPETFPPSTHAHDNHLTTQEAALVYLTVEASTNLDYAPTGHKHAGEYAPLVGGKVPAQCLDVSATTQVVTSIAERDVIESPQTGDRVYVLDPAGDTEYIWTGTEWKPVSTGAISVIMSWGNLQDVPDTFPPAAHDHDGKYVPLVAGKIPSELIPTPAGKIAFGRAAVTVEDSGAAMVTVAGTTNIVGVEDEGGTQWALPSKAITRTATASKMDISSILADRGLTAATLPGPWYALLASGGGSSGSGSEGGGEGEGSFENYYTKAQINELLGISRPAAPIAEGLVAYYPLKENANDYSDHHHHGSVTGNVTFADKAVFEDYFQCIDFPDEMLPLDAFSFCFRACSHSTNSPMGFAFQIGYGPSPQRLYVGVQDTWDTIGMGTWEDDKIVPPPMAMVMERHYAVTYDGETYRYYISGQLIDAREIQVSLGSGRRMGNRFGAAAHEYQWRGTIRELVTYSRPLTADEIQRIATGA